jgi:hypothetical protein
MTILEEIFQMAFNQRDFRKDKAKVVKVRTVCGGQRRWSAKMVGKSGFWTYVLDFLAAFPA